MQKKGIKMEETTITVEGMPQNIYTQIIGLLVILFGKHSEINLSLKEIELVKGCVIWVENDQLKIKGFSNGG